MRIVIDYQGAQGVSRNRGIGRYIRSLVKAMILKRNHHEILLVLNGAVTDTLDIILEEFKSLLPRENIHLWYPIQDENQKWANHASEFIREAFLANLKPDVVLLCSLFEGGQNYISSIGTFAQTIPTAVIFYDLIPLIYRDIYLENPFAEQWYEGKLKDLRHADLLLAISHSSAEEGLNYLGFEHDKVAVISSAGDSHFVPATLSSEQERLLRKKYAISRQFIMYTGGIDHRKNIEGLIRAYAKLSLKLRAENQLVIVCSIREEDRTRLSDVAKTQGLSQNDVIFTGFVSDEELIYLYNLCKLFVFPSWHEGFGLPILEAMQCGRAVIGANNSSLPEVIGREDAMFDPRDDNAITEKITHVLTDDNYRKTLEAHGLEHAKKFTWENCAKHALQALEKLHEQKTPHAIQNFPLKRPKLAFVSPLPPLASGISDYSAELLPELARHYDIDVIITQETISNAWIKANCPIRSVAWFKSHAFQYDRVLYQFGNSAFHQHMFDLIAEIPGVVVLHDFFLSGIVSHMEFHGINHGMFTTELYKAHGYAALLDRFYQDIHATIMKYPCNYSALQRALGVVVHSNHSLDLAKTWNISFNAPWVMIPLLRTPVFHANRSEARKKLQLNSDYFIVASFGMLSSTKLNHRLLTAWLQSDLVNDERCVLFFCGESSDPHYTEKLQQIIKNTGLAHRVTITGRIDGSVYKQYLTAADVGVQLRTNGRGETSAALLDCMNYGLPIIVNHHGSMSEAKDSAVLNISDDFSDEELIQSLNTLWKDKELRTRLGSQAQTIVRSQHAPRKCADQYAESIEKMYHEARFNTRALTQSLASLSQEYHYTDFVKLAKDIHQNFPIRNAKPQLLLDVTDFISLPRQKIPFHIVKELSGYLRHPPEGFRVEPIYHTADRGFCYARHFTLSFLDCPTDLFKDEPIDYQMGDKLINLNTQSNIELIRK